MRSSIRLDEANAAVVSLYFAPVWGIDAARALHSPYLGFDSQTHAVAVGYYRVLLGLGPEGLVWVSHVLAGTKLLIAVGFLAYLVDVLRALVVGRAPDAATLDLTFVLAGAAIVLWAWPALRSGDAALVRLHASEFLLLCGAMLVIAVAYEAIAHETPAHDAREATAVMDDVGGAPPLTVPGTPAGPGPAAA